MNLENLSAFLDAQLAAKPASIYCSRCGRELTDEASKAAGIGPICVTKESVVPAGEDDE